GRIGRVQLVTVEQEGAGREHRFTLPQPQEPIELGRAHRHGSRADAAELQSELTTGGRDDGALRERVVATDLDGPDLPLGSPALPDADDARRDLSVRGRNQGVTSLNDLH